MEEQYALPFEEQYTLVFTGRYGGPEEYPTLPAKIVVYGTLDQADYLLRHCLDFIEAGQEGMYEIVGHEDR